ncbi:MAG: glucose-1-phosphate adenylyltransferase [Candidatus Faecousia sp.]|nr:glucose-1-phosphate adenylyltransferase [Clostridiales bacterium]MCI6936492.1 glucose-1-phosphate adenylyltransferase [Clostridiales bacterium]MDD5883325.1 glucose-1-phosphate adenylyltransferase [Bacillota bacterium]MDY4599211.1 glucose-1-phosphate adenylyltransferase [Candidatus Faecousia sp.]
MYFQKKRVIAMLLAGGQGSRLKVLTEKTAKPAVPFGGKYRIIDFPLSNCVNSGIDTVGILTQYQPLELNEYIGNGQPWGLNKTHSCAQVLPPYERHDKKSGWYKGTANAIYQNIDFVDRFNPDYVVVLSGDHIYKMDYSAMVEYHEKSGASCTIAVRNVSLEEATRFGILNTNPDNTIYEFEEKPAHPKSTNASMGIYCFTWSVLRDALLFDEDDPKSSNDFGKNIIPMLLAAGHKMMAYPFDGYWKDVGTIDSLWEANMDLLGKNPTFQLRGSKKSTIYARNSALPSSYIDEKATIVDSFVAEGCEVYGSVKHSVISMGCTIGDGAQIEDAVIMPGVVVEAGAIVRHAILGENSHICRNAVVGGAFAEGEKKKISVTSKGAVVEANAVLKPGDML